ncbi:MAG: hypothetical protein R2710_20365 [Acidimicrobiales bacterium]
MALAELFDVPTGTMRTALSRMVSNGELTNDDGVYALSGRLLRRQRLQREGRAEPTGEWNGDWVSVLVSADRRSVAARRAFRSALSDLRFGELRPDAWLRPDNLGAAVREQAEQLDDVIVLRGSLDRPSNAEVAHALWPLDELAAAGRRLLSALEATSDRLDGDDPTVLPGAFTISAAVVRHLTVDPQLPLELHAGIDGSRAWPAHELRTAYDHYERRFQRLLRSFLVARIS